MLAAESIFGRVSSGKDLDGVQISEYDENVKNSWVYKELKESRNFKGGFDKGLWFGMLHGRIIATTKGREPWTLKHRTPDSESTKPKD